MSKTIRVKTTRTDNKIHEIDFENYVCIVTPSETPASWHSECLKCQAIVARTYAENKIRTSKNKTYDVDDTTNNQAYHADKVDSRSTKAVQDTCGEVLTYNGKIIDAVFSASNGGRQVSAKERWGNTFPYLIAQDDPFDKHEKFGHGVGYSQWGGKYRAEAGQTYKEILAFYYPGTKIEKLNYENSQPDVRITRTLRKNDRGDDVKLLQSQLYELGFTIVGKADGIFGNNTEKALKEWQKKNGLVADGIFGSKSNAKMFN